MPQINYLVMAVLLLMCLQSPLLIGFLLTKESSPPFMRAFSVNSIFQYVNELGIKLKLCHLFGISKNC